MNNLHNDILFFNSKSRESFCFLKILQELLTLLLVKKAKKKKVWFFFSRILRNLVHATNKKEMTQNIVHAFYPLKRKYTFFPSLQSSFWGLFRGRISTIWGKIVWKMLLKGIVSKILIFMNLQRTDKINILKHYYTDNHTICFQN